MGFYQDVNLSNLGVRHQSDLMSVIYFNLTRMVEVIRYNLDMMHFKSCLFITA